MPTPTKAPKRPQPSSQIKRLAYQKTTPEGHVRWFCSACQKGFLVQGEATPDACPTGHGREAPER